MSLEMILREDCKENYYNLLLQVLAIYC